MAVDMGYECLGVKGGEIYKTPFCSIINPILTSTTCMLWNMGCITLFGERLTFSTLLSDWLNKDELDKLQEYIKSSLKQKDDENKTNLLAEDDYDTNINKPKPPSARLVNQ